MRDAGGPGFDIRDGSVERLRELLGAAHRVDREAKGPRVRRVGRHAEMLAFANSKVCALAHIAL